MTKQYPITPPSDLRKQWLGNYYGNVFNSDLTELEKYLVTQASQWGYEQRGASNEAELQKARDEELEACCEWLTTKAMAKPWETVPRPVLVTALVLELRAARRPKPPSLKEQALMALEDGDTGPGASLTPTEVSIIRRALEALPDD